MMAIQTMMENLVINIELIKDGICVSLLSCCENNDFVHLG
jgi:hypothetical protein